MAILRTILEMALEIIRDFFGLIIVLASCAASAYVIGTLVERARGVFW